MGGAVEAAALPYIDQPLHAVAAHPEGRTFANEYRAI